MKIAVWRTGHEIADTVAEAVYEGLSDQAITRTLLSTSELGRQRLKDYDICIGYGILRGMSEVFRAASDLQIPWIEIDKGYWKPGHFDGYYRISLRGTQQTTGLDKLKPDYERWDALGLEILPSKQRLGSVMVCPPTEYVWKFFGIDPDIWHSDMNWSCKDSNEYYFERSKDSTIKLQADLDVCSSVITFNSSVGWEALRHGIPVMSDPQHSIVGAYQKMLDIDLSKDSNERRKFFAIQAGLQLRLDEIKQGLLWPLLQTLLTIN